MTVKYVNEGGGGLWSKLATLASVVAAPFTAGTSLAWLPGAIGAVNGIARGDPIGAIAGGLGVLGATGGLSGIFGNGGGNISNAANTAKDVTFNMPTTADYAASLTTGQMPTITANMGNTASNIANASKGFDGTDWLKLGALGLGNGNKQQTMATGGGQQPMTNGTNHLQAYTNSLSKKANEFDY